MENIAVKYNKVGANLEYNTFVRGLRADSLTYFSLNSNYTYTLNFHAVEPIMDSMVIIIQEGTFEIPSSRLMEGKDAWGNLYNYFSGRIYFYPDNEDYWGGKFNLYINSSTLVFSPPIKISEIYNGDLVFYNWKQ